MTIQNGFWIFLAEFFFVGNEVELVRRSNCFVVLTTIESRKQSYHDSKPLLGKIRNWQWGVLSAGFNFKKPKGEEMGEGFF